MILFLAPCIFHITHGTVLDFMGLFVLGITAFERRVGLIGRAECAACLAAASVVCLWALTGLAAAVGLGTAVAILRIKGTNRLLAFLGRISYSLYLVHVPIGGRIINLGERMHGGFPVKVAFLVAATAVSLTAAYAMYRFVELPCKDYASGMRFTNLDRVI
jgi:peptidoglycan/LPS O-acetylase OafA/YrhL